MQEPSTFEPAAGWGTTAAEVVERWGALGRQLEVPGARTMVWRTGEGEPAVLLHGVPASAFLYRKVMPRIARYGFAAIAFDLPGLGFAERFVPEDAPDAIAAAVAELAGEAGRLGGSVD